MHSLFLCTGGEAHGEVFDGSSESRRQMTLEMGENQESIGF